MSDHTIEALIGGCAVGAAVGASVAGLGAIPGCLGGIAVAAVSGCAGGEPPDDTSPPPPPSDDDLVPDPPGDRYDCASPTESAGFLIRAHGVRSPQRVAGRVEQSEPGEASCSFFVLDRDNAESKMVMGRQVFEIPLLWLNAPEEVAIDNSAMAAGRSSGAPLTKVFRGEPGSDIRAEGDWWSLLLDAGLYRFEPVHHFILSAALTMTPGSCDAEMSIRQEDESEFVGFPTYENACPDPEDLGDAEPIVLCDNNEGETPCEGTGMTGADKVEIIPLFGVEIAVNAGHFFENEGYLVLPRELFSVLDVILPQR